MTEQEILKSIEGMRLRVFRYLALKTRNRSLAEDLTQDALFKIWRYRDRIDERGVEPYGWVVVISILRDYIRKHAAKENRTFPIEEAYSLAVEDSYSLEEFGQAERLINEVCTSKYSEPMRLFYVEDAHYEEIARRLDLPLGTVRSRLFRGLRQLRKSGRGKELQEYTSR